MPTVIGAIIDNYNTEFIKKLILESDKIYYDNFLIRALEYDNLEIAKYLIELGADIHITQNYAFRTAFALNNKQFLKFLFKSNGNINAHNSSVLLYASRLDLIKAIKLSIKYGASIDRINIGLIHACECGNIKIAKYLLKYGATYINNALEQCIYHNGPLKSIKFLLKLGAYKNLLKYTYKYRSIKIYNTIKLYHLNVCYLNSYI